jgi:ketosteroid isomerase-like protein
VSEAGVDIARRAIAAFNARDVDAFAALTSPDFEWIPSMSPIEGETFHGRAGIDRYFELLAAAWEHFSVDPEDFRLGAGIVLALGRLEGRGRGSGATVDASLGMAFWLGDGSITRIRGFLDHGEALRALGLEP